MNKSAIHLLENKDIFFGIGYLQIQMPLIELNKINKICWCVLSRNPNAIHLLEQNLDRINWDILFLNPNAIHILEQSQNKINWFWLSRNSRAIHLLEQNQNKIDWFNLFYNPGIFEINYFLNKKM